MSMSEKSKVGMRKMVPAKHGKMSGKMPKHKMKTDASQKIGEKSSWPKAKKIELKEAMKEKGKKTIKKMKMGAC
jgi:hypothetical protein